MTCFYDRYRFNPLHTATQRGTRENAFLVAFILQGHGDRREAVALSGPSVPAGGGREGREERERAASVL